MVVNSNFRILNKYFAAKENAIDDIPYMTHIPIALANEGI